MKHSPTRSMIWCSIKYRTHLWFFVVVIAVGILEEIELIQAMILVFAFVGSLGMHQQRDPIPGYGMLPIRRRRLATHLWLEFVVAFPFAIFMAQCLCWLFWDVAARETMGKLLRFAAVDVLVMSILASSILLYCLPAPLSWRKQGWGKRWNISAQLLGIGIATALIGCVAFVWTQGTSSAIVLPAVALIGLSFMRKEDLLDVLQSKRQTTPTKFHLGSATQAAGFNVYRRIASIALKNLLMLVVPLYIIRQIEPSEAAYSLAFVAMAITAFSLCFIYTIGRPREARCLPWSTGKLAWCYLAFPLGSVAVGFGWLLLLSHVLNIVPVAPHIWLSMAALALTLTSMLCVCIVIMDSIVAKVLTVAGIVLFFRLTSHLPQVENPGISLKLCIFAVIIMVISIALLRLGLNRGSDLYRKRTVENLL